MNKKIPDFKFTSSKSQCGQALVTLLFFIIIGITITTAAIVISLTNSLNSSKYQVGSSAYDVAESGAENAVLRFIRNPSYTGETLVIPEGTLTGSATIQVTNGTPVTVLSTGTLGNSIRKVQVQISYTNNVASVSSWKEVY